MYNFYYLTDATQILSEIVQYLGEFAQTKNVFTRIEWTPCCLNRDSTRIVWFGIRKNHSAQICVSILIVRFL